MRLLARLRQHAALGHRPVLALELVLVVGPAADDVTQRLLPHLTRVVRMDAEAFELGTRRRAAGAELDPTAGDQVEHRRRLGRAHGMVVRLGQQAHAVAEAHVLRLHRDGAVEHLGVRAMRILLEEVVLDRPERVEAHLVAEHRLLDGVLVGQILAVVVPRARDGDLVEHRKFHAGVRATAPRSSRADGGAAPDPGSGRLDLRRETDQARLRRRSD